MRIYIALWFRRFRDAWICGLLLLVFCCSSRSMTPITETYHRHLSSARFFAVSYPSHMLLISCSLFLPLVRFPVILPSRTSRSNTSCRRTCPSHLRFRWFIVLMIQQFSLTRSELQSCWLLLSSWSSPSFPYPHFKSFDPFHICFRYCPCLWCIQGHIPYQTFNDSFPWIRIHLSS